jgi:hypothetical protein
MRNQRTELRYTVSASRKMSEYEELTLHTQWSPSSFAKQGWFNYGAKGRPPWDENSTRIRCVTVPKPESWWFAASKITGVAGAESGYEGVIAQAGREANSGWWGYRDPSRQWFRTFVEAQAAQEASIEAATRGALQLGLYKPVSADWLSFVGSYYAAYRHAEYGLFMALCYAQREALSDVVATVLLLQAVDKERHAQDIALYCMSLEEAIEGFSDANCKQIWLEDAAVQPIRKYVELLLACRDWAEIAFAINLVFEPLVGRLFYKYLVAQQSCASGDPVAPMIVASAEADSQRSIAASVELARYVIANLPENKATIEEWLGKWIPLALAAANALRPLAKGIV